MEVLIILSLLIFLAFFPEPKFKKFSKKYRILKNALFAALVLLAALLVLSVLLK